MKTNILKKLPLLAFLMGIGLMLGLSSFKPEKKFANVRLYRLGTGSTWITQAQLQGMIGEDQEFVCNSSPNYCNAEFNDTDSPSGTTPSEAHSGTIVLGNGAIQEIQ